MSRDHGHRMPAVARRSAAGPVVPYDTNPPLPRLAAWAPHLWPRVHTALQVTCLTLERKHFDRLMGPMSEVLNRNVFRSVFVALPAAKRMTDCEIDAIINATDVVTFAPGDVIIAQVRGGGCCW